VFVLNRDVERSRMVILPAAVEELAEAGNGAFTIELVAARAGQVRSTHGGSA